MADLTRSQFNLPRPERLEANMYVGIEITSVTQNNARSDAFQVR